MPFERIRALQRTLRFRLMLWNAGAVLLTALVALVVVREGVHRSLLDELDQRLTEDILEIALALEEPRAPDFEALYDELDRKARGHSRHEWFVRLFDAAGEQLWASQTAPPVMPSENRIGDFRPATVGASRVVQHRAVQRDGTPVTIRVGGSLDFLTADMRQIDRLVLLVGFCALILAPAGGYLLAGRATRPLGQIISTTAALRPHRFEERLPIRQTGDELDQLSQTINGLLDRIAAYLKERQDFRANAAHELRTPLAAIRSSVEVALGSDRSPHEYEELLGAVIEECSSLESLVNQLLLLAEAEADAERIHDTGQRTRLDNLVRRSVEIFRGTAEAKDIDLQIRGIEPVLTSGDPRYLRQVLNNLLDNAVKFTPEHGAIVIEVLRDAAHGTAELRVTDSGAGITPEDMPHIFDRFFRADRSRNREGETRGTGLGLPICQAIVQAVGGKIAAESAPGRGTTFRVILPDAGDIPPNAVSSTGTESASATALLSRS